MKNTLLLLLLILAFAGCKHDEQPEPDHEVWQEITHFKGRNKILINSIGTDDALYVYGLGRVTLVTDPDNSGEYAFQDWAGFGHTDILYKPIMHPDFILKEATSNNISLKTTDLSTFGSLVSTFNIRTQDLIPVFDIDKSKYWDGSYIAANDHRQLLIPIANGEECILASLEMPFHYQITDVDLKKVKFPFYLSYFNGTSDFFIAAAPGLTYRVDSLGDYVQVSNKYGIKQLVRYDRDTAVLGDEFYLGITWGGRFATSFDDGYTWSFGEDRFEIELFQFVNLEGKIFGYNERGGIIHLIIKDDEIEIKQINTEGITNEITSLSKFKNDYIVTTFSGAFKKTASEFFTYVNY